MAENKSVWYDPAPRCIWYVEKIDKQAAKTYTEPIVITPAVSDTVYIGNVDGTLNQIVVDVQGKCKALTLSSTTKVGVMCGDVVARVELVNCKKTQCQIQGACPIVQIDKTDQSTVFLSQACLDLDPTTLIYSSWCTGVNICAPTADGEDMVECPVPEQTRNQIVDGALACTVLIPGEPETHPTSRDSKAKQAQKDEIANDAAEAADRAASAAAADKAMEDERARCAAEAQKAEQMEQMARLARQKEADKAMEEERQRLLAEAKKKDAVEQMERQARQKEADAAMAQEKKDRAGEAKRSSPAAAVMASALDPKDLEGGLALLTDTKAGVNYVMVEVAGKKGSILKICGHGTGGFAEMLDKLDEKKVYFIGIKVIGVDQRSVNSTRTKYAVATYIGTKAPMMQKAGASTIKAKLTQAWGGISLYYSVSDRASFTTEDLKTRLLQCGGAHKPSYYDFGDGTKINLGFYDEHKGGGR
jgi:hypothetical protein